DEVVVTVVNARIENRDQVRVTQAGTEPGLAADRLGRSRIAAQVLERALDHDVALKAVGALDAGAVDACRTASADRLDEHVGPNAIALVGAGRGEAHARLTGVGVPGIGVSEVGVMRARCSIARTRSPSGAVDRFHLRW